MPIFEITREKLSECIGELANLIKSHRDELDYGTEIHPDIHKLLDIERNQNMLTLVVRVGGVAVGYSVNMIYNSTTDSRKTHGQNAFLFVSDTYRHTGAGTALLRETDAALEAAGVDRILYSSPRGSRLGAILQRRGFTATEILYERDVDGR